MISLVSNQTASDLDTSPNVDTSESTLCISYDMPAISHSYNNRLVAYISLSLCE